MIYLANIRGVFGSRGSLEQAGGHGRWVFLDQLPEAGGGMSGSWIRGLALFPRRQVELLRSPAGKKGGDVSNRHILTHDDRTDRVYLANRDMAAVLAMVTTLDM